MTMTVVIVWVLAAVGIVQAIFAARAYRLERREGLARSTKRFAGTVVIAALLVGLGVFATLTERAAATPAPVAEAPATKPDAATQQQIDQLEAEIAELSAKVSEKQEQLAKLDPSKPAAGAVIEPAPPPSPWPAIAAVALVIIGFGFLTLGDLQTLLPKQRGPEPSTTESPAPSASGSIEQADEAATLPNLVAHATAGRWKQGGALASRIPIERLHKLEMLDFLYLKALCGAMSVTHPEDGKPVGTAAQTEALTGSIAELDRVLELAPHMAEAAYLRGYLKAHAGEHQAALEAMRTARAELGDVAREFARDESVCLLSLAEAKLAAADNDGATKLFDEVTQLGVMSSQIPVAMVTHRILTVRAQIKDGKYAEAADGIARIRQVEGLDEAAQRASGAACDVYDVAIRYRSGKLDDALGATAAFFERWQPQNLPPVDDQVADEFLLPAIDRDALPLPAELYRGLYFLEAVIRVELAARAGRLDDAGVDTIATALLRALQFQPRHREALAALAALYLAFRADRAARAIAWLDAALVMGVRSQAAHNLLADARRVEVERKELLAMFRAAAGRFLSDPAVGVAVRSALIEELGRFDEFRPVVLDLQDSGALDAAPVTEVTLTNLRERAQFVLGVAGEAIRRGDPSASQKLADLQRELASLTANVDTSAIRIAALERQVMEQLGKLVLR